MIARYKKAGARLFLALANHHDSFDTWNSRHRPWNAVNFGPRRDVIGEWAAAARQTRGTVRSDLTRCKELVVDPTGACRGQERTEGRGSL